VEARQYRICCWVQIKENKAACPRTSGDGFARNEYPKRTSRRIERWLSIRREVVAGRKGEWVLCCSSVPSSRSSHYLLCRRSDGLELASSFNHVFPNGVEHMRQQRAKPTYCISGSGTEGDEKIQVLVHTVRGSSTAAWDLGVRPLIPVLY
jgi:hypothetical protein